MYPDAALAPMDAARELRDLARFDDALRTRLEGVLWMVVGLVFTALFLAYSFAVVSDAPTGVLAVLWVPFVAAGAAVLWGMRQGFALAGSELGDARAAWALLAFAAGSVASFFAVMVVGSERSAGVALLAFSALALAPPLVDLGFTPTGRRVALAVGALGVVMALVALLVGEGEVGAWAGAVFGLAWVVGGVYQVRRAG